MPGRRRPRQVTRTAVFLLALTCCCEDPSLQRQQEADRLAAAVATLREEWASQHIPGCEEPEAEWRQIVASATSVEFCRPGADGPRTNIDTPEIRRILDVILRPERLTPCDNKGCIDARLVIADASTTMQIWLFSEPRWLSYRERYYQVMAEEFEAIMAAVAKQGVE